MDENQFTNGFLRIASRFKEQGTRRSKLFRRRYTGSKGIGRLAAHKLALFMQVDSVSGTPGQTSTHSIAASIDWEGIEKKQTLTDLEDEVTLEGGRLKRAAATGTTITLSRLRRPWTDNERLRFIAECRSVQVPEALKGLLPTRVLPKPLLFAAPVLRDAASEDPGCDVRLEGDFQEGEGYWDDLIDQTNWILEIDCKSDQGTVKYSMGSSKKTKQQIAEAGRRDFTHPHPAPGDGPFFQARILARDEQIRQSRLLRWSRQASGIRVYLEGFRVLPYGDSGDDWLKIDADVARRGWKTDDQFDQLVEGTEAPEGWKHSVLPNSSYTGAVFLTQDDAPTLRMLVNREGFVTDRAYDALVEIVRRGIDLLTRTRAAANAPARQRAREQAASRPQPVPPETKPPVKPPPAVPESADGHPVRSIVNATNEAVEAIREARQMIASGRPSEEVSQRLEFSQTVMVEVITAADRVADSAAMLRVLASLGTQLAGFVHEIRNLLGTAIVAYEAVGRLRGRDDIPSDARSELNTVYQHLGDMRQQIERQATFLVDVTSPDARRRRSRQKVAERFDAATRLVAQAASRRGIEVLNEIPDDVRTPPMFPAELTSVLTNLLSNAVKAAGKEGGSIRARGKMLADGAATLTLENTGVRVDLAESERWFRPFESTTTEVDSSLGQGMGLGLTITREILDQYGATIRFVPPAKGYDTAVEVHFPS